MSNDRQFNSFLKDIEQHVLGKVESIEAGAFKEESFTELFIEYLTEFGEIDDGTVLSHRARGMQINGYAFSDDLERLTLFVTLYHSSGIPLNARKSDVELSVKRVLTFYEKCLQGLYTSIEEASPVFDLCQQIFQEKDQLNNLDIYFLTDGIVNSTHTIEKRNSSYPEIKLHIWDSVRLFRLVNSGKQREEIEVDLTRFGEPVKCLGMSATNNSYYSYLAVFPAATLVNIYGEYGTRLLERNVRSFLQARGAVNKGIRNTLRDSPHMFLAYNNGLSAVAQDVVVESDAGVARICKIRDLQIVNGGQTTASLYYAFKRDKVDLSGVFVQVKLTVIKETEDMDTIVPLISEYANSQNKIQTADFSANHAYHRKIEEFSSTIWAPAGHGMQKQTKWFYERARGQYSDLLNRETGKTHQKRVESEYPKHQLLSKTDLAKYEHTWAQFPHLVSRGAQKNFNEFMIRINEQKSFVPDQRYYENLIAKAILFRKTEKIVQGLKLGGYRANIVTYTLSWLSHYSQQRINLRHIWELQGLTQRLEETIQKIAREAHKHILKAPGNGNVTEWCKRQECWDTFKRIKLDLPPLELDNTDLLSNEQDKGIEGLNDKDLAEINLVSKIPSDLWYELAAWSKETGNFAPWQRSLVLSLGKLATSGRKPSVKQTRQGMIILNEAERIGYPLPSEIVNLAGEG